MPSDIVEYYLDEQGRFIIDNYNWSKPFSNFFPGIGGKRGIPLWAYYVNKAQGICSMGIKDKDHAIFEFLSFNKACQVVGRQGFRTFIKTGEGLIYEAFQKTDNQAITQRMIVSAHELEIQETNRESGFETRVVYFPLVNLPIAGLVRKVIIQNISDEKRAVEILDGAPRVLPYGVNFEHVKVIARHIEGMMGVFDANGIPLYKLKQSPADIEEIRLLEGGNFYCTVSKQGQLLNENIIVDPQILFGEIENIDFPWEFANNPRETVLSKLQIKENRTPCGFTLLQETLSPGEKLEFQSVIGSVKNTHQLEDFAGKINDPTFLSLKREENQDVIDQIKHLAFTVSGESAFDQYCQQTALDNVMRGGLPLNFKTEQGAHIFHIFNRQGGGLERDYHWFDSEPTYLSQGNGHYRNVLQNRRMDTWFFPEVGDHNIITFMNLIQLDGYNPLVVEGVSYVANDIEKIKKTLQNITQHTEGQNSLIDFVQTPFSPGKLLMKLEESLENFEGSYEQVLAELLALCTKNEIGALHEGFWIDHWFYNLDLIESFLAIFPDRGKELLLDRQEYTFFDNPDVVMPRSKKTVLMNGKLRQYGAVLRDPEKEALLNSRTFDANKVHTQHGHGEVYKTNLLTKLLCILTNKIASLDSSGIGVEMEAGKPGWCDSLNGLPGLFGSSLCETLELIRLCRLLLECLKDIEITPTASQLFFEELHTFITGINNEIERFLTTKNNDRHWTYWDNSHTLKEIYRENTKFGVSGKEVSIPIQTIKGSLSNCLQFLEGNLSSIPKEWLYKEGVPFTYFINQVEEYDETNKNDLVDHHVYVSPKSFQQKPVALFLEGPTHYLRVYPEHAPTVYEGVRSSAVFDQKLNTFKCCEPLDEEPFEIGRIKAYPAGWIEHEAIYTHMQFKWLLEILRAGLYEEFFEEIKKAFPPFLDPHIYGRSILENCSFIAGSAHPDEKIHGQAFQPRYSGVTSEFANIWMLMVMGPQPFSLDENGELDFSLQPTLPDWMFTQREIDHHYWKTTTEKVNVTIPANSFAFNMFGGTLVSYLNPLRKHTFGDNAAKIQSLLLTHVNGKTVSFSGDKIDTSLAIDIRDKKIGRIEAELV